jgi:hypothetical protein
MNGNPLLHVRLKGSNRHGRWTHKIAVGGSKPFFQMV